MSRKNEQFNLRVAPSVVARAKRDADTAGLDYSEYIAYLILHQPVTTVWQSAATDQRVGGAIADADAALARGDVEAAKDRLQFARRVIADAFEQQAPIIENDTERRLELDGSEDSNWNSVDPRYQP